MRRSTRRVADNASSGRTSQVRLMVGIPVLTTFFVLVLGLAVMEISRRTLLATNDISPLSVQASISEIVVAVLLIAVVAFVAGSALALSLTKPMKILAEKAEHVARGDLTGALGEVPLAGHPEFAALGTAFNSMVESLNKTFVNGVNCGIVLIDCDGKVTFANQNAADLLGFDFDAVIGKEIKNGSLGAPEFSDLLSIVNDTLEHKAPVSGKELEIKTSYGNQVQLRLSTSLFRDARSETVGVSLWIEDVTSLCLLRKDLEQLEKLVIFAGFVEGIAHQVRNPLCSIRGYAQLIKERGGAEFAELPDGIINHVDMIDKVIRSFLEAPEREMLSGDTAAIAVRELRSALLPEMKRGA